LMISRTELVPIFLSARAMRRRSRRKYASVRQAVAAHLTFESDQIGDNVGRCAARDQSPVGYRVPLSRPAVSGEQQPRGRKGVVPCSFLSRRAPFCRGWIL
jgi:hypothetical protein